MTQNKALVIRNFQSKFLAIESLSIEPNETVGLTGPSGSGKSMTLRALVDLEENQGDVALGSLARATTAPEVWRRTVAWVPATPVWWEETIRAHFVGNPEARLSRLGFTDMSLLNDAPSRLSSGESQRLGLARSLSRNPSALLLDEPTANLDPTSARLVESEILDYQMEHGAPMIWIGHDTGQLSRFCSRIYELRDQRLHQIH